MEPQLLGVTALCFGSELSVDPIVVEITAFLCVSRDGSAQTKSNC